MNHTDDERVPDFYKLAAQEQVDHSGPAWSAYPAKTNKKKSKRKVRSHGLHDDTAPGVVEESAAQRIVEHDRLFGVPGGCGDELDLDSADFSPDPSAMEDVGVEPASLRDLHPYVDNAALDDELRSEVSSLARVIGSPRSVPSRPAAQQRSPPIRHTTTYGSPENNNSLDGYERPPIAARRTSSRRESFPTESSLSPHFVEPKAPPHKLQPHFYGLPTMGFDLGLSRKQSAGQTAGSNGYCCCFDSFADCGDVTSARKANDALLVGSEGSLEVFRVLSNKVEVIGRLDGLRGSVIGAKILPKVELRDDLRSARALVAVVVHGLIDEREEARHRGSSAGTCSYQTSVEILSLQTQQHVATLWKSWPIYVPVRNADDSATAPENITLDAQGKFMIVASGKSGEVFIFSSATGQGESNFRCIGKVWTSLQISLESSSSRPPTPSTDEAHSKPGTPLFSLSQRWLAIVPPSTSSNISIQCSPTMSESNPSPYGLASAVAPPQPPVTCEVTGVDAEDAWSRLTRQAAQGVVKYSQKGIDLGWQGWKELTNPTPQATPHSNEREVLFPPTKAPPEDPLRPRQEPATVSILDLEALLEAQAMRAKHAPGPAASFSLNQGCNFLSFSTSGLRLLTVSRKGETSTIWDLSASCHGHVRQHKSVDDHGSNSGPRVRQVHRIPRNSPTVVVESAWSREDDWIAMLTTHGTVHLHEIPVQASRKRKRRSTTADTSLHKGEPTVSLSEGTSPPSSNGGLLGSLKSGWQQVSTQVTGIRASSSTFGIPTSFAGFRDATASVGTAGGRVLAKGLSQGLNAAKEGASDYWHADDNKIRHKALQDARPRALKWIRRQSDVFLAIVCQGVVHLHPVQRAHRRKGDEDVSDLKHDKYGLKHFTLPTIRTRAGLDGAAVQIPAAKSNLRGFWSLRTPADRLQQTPKSPTPMVQINEVDTNPPYCPFHIDNRVDIFTFDGRENDDKENAPGRSKHRPKKAHPLDRGQQNSGSWLFGQPLPSSVKMNTHDDLDYPARGSELGSDGEGDLEEQVRSILTIHAGDGDDEGSTSISIRSQVLRRGVGDDDLEDVDEL